MARTLTPRDCYALINAIVKQATGQNAVTAIDPSTFVSAGELALASGKENVMNALSIVLAKTMIAVRPYDEQLNLIRPIDSGIYSNRLRKISFYTQEAKASGAFNTQLFTNLGTGLEAGEGADAGATKSQWEQDPAVPLEVTFGGSSTWQDVLTRYEHQIQVAFTNEREFADFISGVMTEKMNEIKMQKEAFKRMTLLNHIAGVYDLDSDMPGSVINLTAGFNAKFGTNYTSAQLRTTYLKEFLAYFVATVRLTSDYMAKENSTKYHWTPAKDGYALLRHTPKAKQKAVLYAPLFTDAEALVLPEIFNPQYLNLENYEGVTYWQGNATDADRSKINVTPAIPNTASPAAQKKGAAVALDYVVGMIFDEDALMVDFQLDNAHTTPMEARKHYTNTWYTMQRNAINDFTENAVIFIMADPASPSA